MCAQRVTFSALIWEHCAPGIVREGTKGGSRKAAVTSNAGVLEKNSGGPRTFVSGVANNALAPEGSY